MKRRIVGIAIFAFIFLNLFYTANDNLQAEEVKEKVPAIQGEYAFLVGEAGGRVFHTFTANDLRNQLLSFSPEKYNSMSPEAVSELFSAYEKKYALEIETAKRGVFSDEEIAKYLVDSGIAEEIGMNEISVLKSLEKIKWLNRYLKPVGEFVEYHVLTPPPPPVYLPAEFQPVGAVYVAWPLYEGWVWKIHADLVREISEATDTWIFVPNQYWQKAVELYLRKKDIDQSRIKFLHIPTDGCWARNWGQLTVFCGKKKTPVFICEHYAGYAFQAYAKKSAKAAIALGEYLGVPVYQLPLVCEQGGNIITDGNGTIMVTERIFEQNPDVGKARFEKILKDYYGCRQIIVLPKLKNEVNGHADFIKFAGPHTIFVSSAPRVSPWHETLEEVRRTLANSRSVDGKSYKIVRVPLPTNYEHSKDFTGWNYNCALMINGRQKKLIVPVYGAPEDEEALKIFRETLPDYGVVGIDYRAYPSGATNCQAVEVPPEVTRRLK